MQPITRKEQFLAAIAGESESTPSPVTREEIWLKKIFENGGSGADLTPYAKKIEVSGIVENEISSIEGIDSDYSYTQISPTINKQYLSKNSKDWVNDSSSFGCTLEVTEGEFYRITGAYQYATALYGLFDATGNNIAIYPNSVGVVVNEQHIETQVVEIPTGVTTLKVSSYLVPLYIEKRSDGTSYSIPEQSNILYGKKIAFCGDSFTAGDFSGYVDADGKTGVNSDAFDAKVGHYKTYPWWIGNRNGMNVQWCAQAGNDFTNIENATRPFSNPNSIVNYTQINPDNDYVIIQFGLNEIDLTTEQIGTKADEDNTTLWGAYNVVLESIYNNNPFVKIGIIISDSWMSQTYHDTLISIANYWGIPYLDLKNGEQVPLGIGARFRELNPKARAVKSNNFVVSSTNSHPNVKAHEYRSTFIENFIRSL